MWLIRRTREDGTFSFVQKTDPPRMSRMNQAYRWSTRALARRALTEIREKDPTFQGTVCKWEPEENTLKSRVHQTIGQTAVKTVPVVPDEAVPALVKAAKPNPDVKKTPTPQPIVGDTEARIKHNMKADLLMATQVARKHTPGDRRSFAERMADELYRLGWRLDN